MLSWQMTFPSQSWTAQGPSKIVHVSNSVFDMLKYYATSVHLHSSSFKIPLFLWNLEKVKECTANLYFLLNDALEWPLREITLLRVITFLVWKTHFFPSKRSMSVLGSLASQFRISLCSLSLTKAQWVEGDWGIHSWHRNLVKYRSFLEYGVIGMSRAHPGM